MIKPCPFCGETDDFGVGIGIKDQEGWPIHIYCGNCGARGPWIYTNDQEALDNTDYACVKTGWNYRVKDKK